MFFNNDNPRLCYLTPGEACVASMCGRVRQRAIAFDTVGDSEELNLINKLDSVSSAGVCGDSMRIPGGPFPIFNTFVRMLMAMASSENTGVGHEHPNKCILV